MKLLFITLALAACVLAAPRPQWTYEELETMLKPLTDVGSKIHAPVVSMTGEPSATTIRPVVLMHGLGDSGANPGMESLATSIMDKYPGSYAVAVKVADGISSILQRVAPQVAQFAKTVRSDPKLGGGFNVVGLSQGGIIIRAYIQQYAGRQGYPPVHRMVSICGVQNGVFDCPGELKDFPIVGPLICDFFKSDPYNFLDGIIPLSFSDYFVLSEDQQKYLSQNTFLPDMNNQLATKNASYTSSFESLDGVYLVEALNDTVVYPYESEQFGGYQWGTKDTVFQMREGDLYKNNLFGLKTLDTSGKVKLDSFIGDHLRFSNQFWNDHILPYLALP